MVIHISDEVELVLYSEKYCNEFFESIHEDKQENEEYRNRLQQKYTTIEKVESRIFDAIENKYKKDGTPDFFIFYNSKLAGVFEFAPLKNDKDFVEVGYWLYQKFRRKGILSSIFPKMICFARDNFDRKRLIATTPTDNIPSQKLLEKVGLKNTGRIEEFKKDNGVVEKDVEYELIL